MSRQESNYACFEVVATTEKEYSRVLLVLETKERETMRAIMSKSLPIKSGLVRQVYNPKSDEFKLVYELRNTKVSQDLIEELTHMQSAKSCR